MPDVTAVLPAIAMICLAFSVPWVLCPQPAQERADGSKILNQY